MKPARRLRTWLLMSLAVNLGSAWSQQCRKLARPESRTFGRNPNGFLIVRYKKPYKQLWFLIQFAKLDRFPTSTQNFSKNLFGNFRPFFANILFFWPLHLEVRTKTIHFHPTTNSRSPFFASKLHFFSPIFTTPFFQFCRFPDLRNSV